MAVIAKVVGSMKDKHTIWVEVENRYVASSFGTARAEKTSYGYVIVMPRKGTQVFFHVEKIENTEIKIKGW